MMQFDNFSGTSISRAEKNPAMPIGRIEPDILQHWDQSHQSDRWGEVGEKAGESGHCQAAWSRWGSVSAGRLIPSPRRCVIPPSAQPHRRTPYPAGDVLSDTGARGRLSIPVVRES